MPTIILSKPTFLLDHTLINWYINISVVWSGPEKIPQLLRSYHSQQIPVPTRSLAPRVRQITATPRENRIPEPARENHIPQPATGTLQPAAENYILQPDTGIPQTVTGIPQPAAVNHIPQPAAENHIPQPATGIPQPVHYYHLEHKRYQYYRVPSLIIELKSNNNNSSGINSIDLHHNSLHNQYSKLHTEIMLLQSIFRRW